MADSSPGALKPMRRSFLPILLLALINGLVFVFLVPPWQHYDEPNNFEYAWLIAHRPGWPQVGDFDREMRVATLQSMYEHEFFRGMEIAPALDAEEPWIGPIPQVGDAPLYFWLAALPLRLFPPLTVTAQLYAARLVSLLLFLGTVALGWATTRLLTPEDSPLRWMVPAFLAALPPFVDIMTAVNNDVAAVAAFALFLFLATRLLVRGWHWLDVLLLLISAGLCLLAKRTVFFAVALIPLVLLFALLRGKKQRWAWGLIGIGAVVMFGLSFRFGDAAAWYRRTPQEPATRVMNTASPEGTGVFRLHIAEKEPRDQLLQFLPTKTVPELAGQTVTLGAWMWASAPINLQPPRIILIGKAAPPIVQGEQQVMLETVPQFYTWVFTIPQDCGSRAWVQFGPSVEGANAPTDVFMDGVVLSIGDFSAAAAPNWPDQTWGGQPIKNYLRGASAEEDWINPRPWVDEAWAKIFGYSSQQFATFVFYTLRDWPAAGWYYRLTSATLFRSFWGTFGWGHVKLVGSKPFRWLLIVTAILSVGGLWGLWRARRKLRGDVLLVYAAALGVSWGLTVVRGAHHVLSASVIIPISRYAFPVLLPLALFFSLGAETWQQALARILPPLRKIPGLLWAIFLVGITLWAWISIYIFYANPR
ncbi:MAG TPA: hypothetical protein DEH22_18190 [Chloroflexi bacterium]|nr:hypothetical protein [Chloroflexota bacterium]